MQFKLFSKNQIDPPDGTAPNKRITLTDTYPVLKQLGIRVFGYYSNKSVQNKLCRGQHDSCYEIHYLETGAQPFYTYAGADTPEEEATLHWFSGGDISITRPYEYHSTGSQYQQRGSAYWIQIDSACPHLFGQSEAHTERLNAALRSMNRHVLHIPKSTASRLSEAFNLLLNLNEDRLLRACCLLTLFVFEIADYNAHAPLDSEQSDSLTDRGLEAIAFIEANLLTPGLDLSMVAAHLNYSRSYTATFFRREIGLTVHEYIMHCKIDCACELLKEHTITEVAAILNYSSSQHFSRLFKDQLGMTPSEFVRRMNEGEIDLRTTPRRTDTHK